MNSLISFDYAYKTQSDSRRLGFEKLLIHSSNSQSLKDRKVLLAILRSIQILTGQAGSMIKTRKSVASFSSREGSEIGVSLSLRRGLIHPIYNWLNSEVFPFNSDPSNPYLPPLSQGLNSSLGVGIDQSNELSRMKIESSLSFIKFGLDIELGLNNNLDNKNFIASYMGFPLKGVCGIA